MFDSVHLVLAELDDLAAAIAALTDQLDALDDGMLEAVVHRVAGLQTRVQSLWLSALQVAEARQVHRRTGARNTATWAATIAGERRGAAARDVVLAGQLSSAPLVAGALASGAVSKAKAAELIHAAVLPETAQAQLIAIAADAPIEQVAAAVQRARLHHGLKDPPLTPSLSITRTRDRATLSATVDLLDAEIVDIATHTAAEALNLPPETTAAERRARGLIALSRHYLDHTPQIPAHRAGRPHVLVLVDLDVLEARTGGTATLASGTTITGDQARHLASDANLTRIIIRGRSEPLDVGRTTRTVPPALAKAVIARDRRCRYQHCTAPPWTCDIHHRVPWASGGPTALHNLGLLCWHHHQHVHHQGPHRVTDTPDGRWTITQPGPAQAAA